MRSRHWLPVAVGLAACTLSGGPRPSFVLLLSDDQSWVGSSVELMGGHPDSRSDYLRTPSLERLARMGMTFSDGYAPAPFCCPTRRSLQVGQTPARHLYQRNQAAWPAAYRRQLTIPRMLKRADPAYRTAHFGKWDHRFDRPSPEQMGYDVSDGNTGNSTGGGKGSGGPAAADDPKLTDHLTRRARAFLGKQAEAGTPFYLQVSFYAVHLDIFYREATLRLVTPWSRGRKHYMPEFAAMTHDMDASVGRILDCLEESGLSDSTYVFFLSDNGGRATLPGAGTPPLPRNHPLRGAKGSMYEGGIRVPFLVAGPGVPAGSRSPVPVTGLDILPTLAELADYPESLPPSVDGGSLRGVLEGDAVVDRQQPFLIFHQAAGRRPQSAIRLGKFKLVRTWEDARNELFDLSADLGETRSIASEHPATAERLLRTLSGFLSEVGATTRRLPN